MQETTGADARADSGVGVLARVLLSGGRIGSLGTEAAVVALAAAVHGRADTAYLARCLGMSERSVRRHRASAERAGIMPDETGTREIAPAGLSATGSTPEPIQEPVVRLASPAATGTEAEPLVASVRNEARPHLADGRGENLGAATSGREDGQDRPHLAGARPNLAGASRAGTREESSSNSPLRFQVLTTSNQGAPRRAAPFGFRLSEDDIETFPTVPGLEGLKRRRVEPLPRGSLVDGCDVCRVLPADICRDVARLVVWWRQQIGTSGAVTGDSCLELVLVVAKALAIARGGARVRNSTAVLVSCLRSGAWRQERDCLADAVRLVSRLAETGDVAWTSSDRGEVVRETRSVG